MICKSCSTFISSHLNIKGYKTQHTFGTSFEEFGAAENFVIGKINNIYSVEMQISLRRGPMNNWVRTITLNNSFLNILQCVFYDQRASWVLWQQQCAANYAERLRPLLIAGRSSFAPAGFFRKDGKTENRERVNNPSFYLPTHIPLLSITEISCTSRLSLPVCAAHE